jgi:hypothetical protein
MPADLCKVPLHDEEHRLCNLLEGHEQAHQFRPRQAIIVAEGAPDGS